MNHTTNPTTPNLIEQQETVLEAMSAIRVMRRGTLSPQVYSQRRARKSGHGACGPYPVLQGYCEGKHFSRRVSVEEAPRLANQIESRQQFEALCARYVSLGEALAERPDAEVAVQEALKKKAWTEVEQSREVAHIVEAMAREAGVDLEAVEGALKAAVLKAGASALQDLLATVGVGRRGAAVRCSCGHRMASRGVKGKQLLTVLGVVRFARSLFVCPRCGKARFPGDEMLGVVGTSRSPGVVRLVARFAAKEPFKEAAQDIREAAGIAISAKDVERIAENLGEEMETWMQLERMRGQQPPVSETAGPPIENLYIEFDGTGVPMVGEAVAGRKGKQTDGSAKTREAKLGCVFTQTTLNDAGKPVRDPASTSFVGAIEDVRAFGARIYDEAVRRGLLRARHVHALSDGAEWAKNTADTHFPMAQHSIDFYHGSEHITTLAQLLYATNPALAKREAERWAGDLYDGRVDTLIHTVQDLLPKDENLRKDARKELAYFVKNASRMRYDLYRAQGRFIGSGIIEAACKHVVGARLKQSGMEWTVRGANAILALRCVILSNRFEEFWEYRATPGNILTYTITNASNVA